MTRSASLPSLLLLFLCCAAATPALAQPTTLDVLSRQQTQTLVNALDDAIQADRAATAEARAAVVSAMTGLPIDAVDYVVADDAARLALSPTNGQWLFQADSGALYEYASSAWQLRRTLANSIAADYTAAATRASNADQFLLITDAEQGGLFKGLGSCTPDNVLTIAAAGGRCWERVWDGRELMASWAGFSTAASGTANRDALHAAIAVADGRPVVVDAGSYQVDNAGADLKSPTVISSDVHIVGRGDVTFLARTVALPTVSGGTSNPISRHVLKIDGASSVRIEGVTFDGGDDLVTSFSGATDVDRTYRAALLEIRDTENVVLEDVWFTRHRPVYSPRSHGTGTEDDEEAVNTGVMFIRNVGEFTSRGGGILGETRNEGWEIIETDVVQIDQFFSGASLIFTPLNVWGAGTTARISGTFENSSGSSIGVGGQGADIEVDASIVNGGGVNLTRVLEDETEGWKSARVRVTGSGLYNVSHGFAVKAGLDLPNSWDGSAFQYPFGALSVHLNVNGVHSGVIARYVESVEVEGTIVDPLNTSALFGGSHTGQAGKGVYLYDSGTCRVRGTISADRTMTIAGTSSTGAAAPDYGAHYWNCEHVDHDVLIRGDALTGKAFLVEQARDGQAVAGGGYQAGTEYNKSVRLSGVFAESSAQVGAATEKVNSIWLDDLLRWTPLNGYEVASGNDMSLFVYRTLPPVPAILSRTTTQSVSAGATTAIVMTAVSSGYSGDADLGAGSLEPEQRGSYQVGGTVEIAAVPAGTVVRVLLTKNGTEVAHSIRRIVSGGASADLVLATEGTVQLNGSTDEIQLRIEHDAASPLDVTEAYLRGVYLTPFN